MRKFARVFGKQKDTVSPAAVEKVFEHAWRIGVQSLASDPVERCVGQSMSKLTFRVGEAEHVIEYQVPIGSCSPSMPKELQKLEDEMDRVGRVFQWIKCRGPGGKGTGCPPNDCSTFVVDEATGAKVKPWGCP